MAQEKPNSLAALGFKHDHHADPELFPFSRPSTPMHQHENRTVGFIGIGAIGFYMARNLARTLPNPTHIWNRTESKAEPLLKELGPNKIHIDKSISDLVNACDIIITCLSNDAAVTAVYDEAYEALQKGKKDAFKIFVETSTIYPGAMGAVHTKLTSFSHVHVLSSAVFGAPPAADSGNLVTILAGDYKAKKEVAYILVPAWGKKIVDMGGNVEKAKGLKLLGNSFILGTIELLAENLALAEKSEIGAEKLYEVLSELFPAVPVRAYGDKIINQKFDGSAGFELSNGIKDATHIRRFAAEYASPLPSIDMAHQNLQTARALQTSPHTANTVPFKSLDWSSLAVGPRVSGGLPAFDHDKISSQK